MTATCPYFVNSLIGGPANTLGLVIMAFLVAWLWFQRRWIRCARGSNKLMKMFDPQKMSAQTLAEVIGIDKNNPQADVETMAEFALLYFSQNTGSAGEHLYSDRMAVDGNPRIY